MLVVVVYLQDSGCLQRQHKPEALRRACMYCPVTGSTTTQLHTYRWLSCHKDVTGSSYCSNFAPLQLSSPLKQYVQAVIGHESQISVAVYTLEHAAVVPGESAVGNCS